MQQVMADEPVPPARLNPTGAARPGTICLKCLHKEPARRYATAAALAEDLQRFLRGEPIAARPPGRWERLVRWLRRHPAQAALLATTVLVVLAAVGGGGWLIGQRTQTVRAVEADVREVVRLQQQSALPEARAALQRAQIRLGDDGPDSARSLVDQARHDQQLLERLEAIRMDRSTFVEGRQDHPADVRLNNAQADREYQKAFRDAALGEAPGDPDGAAARIKASPLRVPLVAALDDWAACSPDTDRRSWIVRVARGADPDAWRNSSATRPPGRIAWPWRSWPGRHPSRSSSRPCCWRWGNGCSSPAGTGSGFCDASRSSIPTTSGPTSRWPMPCTAWPGKTRPTRPMRPPLTKGRWCFDRGRSPPTTTSASPCISGTGWTTMPPGGAAPGPFPCTRGRCVATPRVPPSTTTSAWP